MSTSYLALTTTGKLSSPHIKTRHWPFEGGEKIKHIRRRMKHSSRKRFAVDEEDTGSTRTLGRQPCPSPDDSTFHPNLHVQIIPCPADSICIRFNRTVGSSCSFIAERESFRQHLQNFHSEATCCQSSYLPRSRLSS